VDAEFQAHYETGGEASRLDNAKGALEFARTIEIISRDLPPAPAVIADIGGGPGKYALWLAELGYTVEHRDVMPLHISLLHAAGHPRIHTQIADARQIDIPSGSVDGVLLLGPLYHLDKRADRMRALREASRILRPGGLIFVSAVSRWAQRLDGLMTGKLYEKYPNAVDQVAEFEATGRLRPFRTGGFVSYTHRPADFKNELRDSGLIVERIVGVEGIPLSADDLEQRLADSTARDALLECARAIEGVPELLGLSSHLLATVRKPS
jgi:SAM-dependent methyltransferase